MFSVGQIKTEKDAFKKARLIRDLVKKDDIKIRDLAKACAVSSSYICHLLRLLRLPEIVVDGYYSANLSLSHLFIISRLKDEQAIVQAYEKILAQNLSVLQLEEYVREKLYSISGKGVRVDEATKQTLSAKYKKIDKNLKIKITQTRIRASVVLQYKGSLKQTSEVLEKLANSG